MTAYILVFDREPTTDYLNLHEGIKKDPYITTWSHYLKSSYILISNYDSKTLAQSIRAYLPQRFLLIQVDRHNYFGWLPKEAWDWIKKNIG